MRIVAALGGNALLERGEKPDEDIQEHHVQQAVTALAPLARSEDLVVTHGNGPQVGMLALESASDPALTRPYSLDVLGAQTQGMIGYWLVRALRGAAPGKHAASLVSQTRVDPDDPAFAHPTKFVGPVYEEKQARDLAAERGWVVARDGEVWRRVVPSPEPLELMELPLIRQLVDSGALVVCAGRRGQGPDRSAAGVRRERRRIAAADRRRRRHRRLRHPGRAPYLACHTCGTTGPLVPGRLDGREGGGGLPIRGGDRQDGGDRPSRRRYGTAPPRGGHHRVPIGGAGPVRVVAGSRRAGRIPR
jgi:hypothetical protein